MVVVDVGYNDRAEGYAANLESVMAAVVAAGVQHVIWVTLRETEAQWVQINEQIRCRERPVAAADHSRLGAIAETHPAWFVDEAHMNELGAEGLVGAAAAGDFAACGNPCVPPEASATIARARSHARPRDAPLARQGVRENLRPGGAPRRRRLEDRCRAARCDDIPATRRARCADAGPRPGPRRR